MATAAFNLPRPSPLGLYRHAGARCSAVRETEACGTNRPGLPALGAWMTYGLGSQNQNLPSYLVLHDTRPRGDDQTWSAGFLPKTFGSTRGARKQSTIWLAMASTMTSSSVRNWICCSPVCD